MLINCHDFRISGSTKDEKNHILEDFATDQLFETIEFPAYLSFRKYLL